MDPKRQLGPIQVGHPDVEDHHPWGDAMLDQFQCWEAQPEQDARYPARSRCRQMTLATLLSSSTTKASGTTGEPQPKLVTATTPQPWPK